MGSKAHLMVAALASLVCSASSPTTAPGFSWTTPQDDKGEDLMNSCSGAPWACVGCRGFIKFWTACSIE